MEPSITPTSLSSEDREELRLLYQVSVSDIAFFKQQQWSLTNHALTIQAALVVVTYQLLKSPLAAWQLWFLLFLICGLSAACLMAVARLGMSIEARRARLKKIRAKFGGPFNDAWKVLKETDDFQWLLISVLVLSAFIGSWLVLARP